MENVHAEVFRLAVDPWQPVWVALVLLPLWPLLAAYVGRLRTGRRAGLAQGAVAVAYAALFLAVLETSCARVLASAGSDVTVVADPVRLWKLVPSSVVGDMRTNSHSLREDHDMAVPRPPEEIRILALGDSWTFGYLVPDGQTWPDQLEARLERDTGRPVEVINAGVPGYSVRQALMTLEDPGLSLQPQVVVIPVSHNGAPQAFLERLEPGPLPEGAVREVRRLLYESHLYLWLRRLAIQRERQAMVGRTPPPRHEESDLVATVQLARSRGLRVLLLGFQGRSRSFDMEGCARRTGAPLLVVDVRDPGLYMTGEGGPVESHHLNPRGYARVAGELARKLEQEGLLQGL